MSQQIQLSQLGKHLQNLNQNSENIEIVENKRVLGELIGIKLYQSATQITGRVSIDRLKEHSRYFITSWPYAKIVYQNGKAIAVLITRKQDKRH